MGYNGPISRRGKGILSPRHVTDRFFPSVKQLRLLRNSLCGVVKIQSKSIIYIYTKQDSLAKATDSTFDHPAIQSRVSSE